MPRDLERTKAGPVLPGVARSRRAVPALRDFNYDGRIDGSDYTLIDNAFNTQDGSLSSSALVAESTNQVAAASALPEPTTLGVIVFATAGLLRRGRRTDGPRQ